MLSWGLGTIGTSEKFYLAVTCDCGNRRFIVADQTTWAWKSINTLNAKTNDCRSIVCCQRTSPEHMDEQSFSDFVRSLIASDALTFSMVNELLASQHENFTRLDKTLESKERSESRPIFLSLINGSNQELEAWLNEC